MIRPADIRPDGRITDCDLLDISLVDDDHDFGIWSDGTFHVPGGDPRSWVDQRAGA
jgi:hypothetical protein